LFCRNLFFCQEWILIILNLSNLEKICWKNQEDSVKGAELKNRGIDLVIVFPDVGVTPLDGCRKSCSIGNFKIKVINIHDKKRALFTLFFNNKIGSLAAAQITETPPPTRKHPWAARSGSNTLNPSSSALFYSLVFAAVGESTWRFIPRP